MDRNGSSNHNESAGTDGSRRNGLSASRGAKFAVALAAVAPVLWTAEPAFARVAVNHNETAGTDTE